MGNPAQSEHFTSETKTVTIGFNNVIDVIFLNNYTKNKITDNLNSKPLERFNNSLGWTDHVNHHFIFVEIQNVTIINQLLIVMKIITLNHFQYD